MAEFRKTLSDQVRALQQERKLSKQLDYKAARDSKLSLLSLIISQQDDSVKVVPRQHQHTQFQSYLDEVYYSPVKPVSTTRKTSQGRGTQRKSRYKEDQGTALKTSPRRLKHVVSCQNIEYSPKVSRKESRPFMFSPPRQSIYRDCYIKAYKGGYFKSSRSRTPSKAAGECYRDNSKTKVRGKGSKPNGQLLLLALRNNSLGQWIKGDDYNKVIGQLQKQKDTVFVFGIEGEYRKRPTSLFKQTAKGLVRVWGKGPELVQQQQIMRMFGYDTGTKQFREIEGCRRLSSRVSAVVLA